MNFAPKSIVSSLAIICYIGLISCTSQDESKPEKRQSVEGDTIEVTGICETEENYAPCPITNVPKYLRQYIGYKYIKGRGNPGYVSLATTQSEIHPDATIYEVFTNDFNSKLQQNLNLGKPVEVLKQNKSCYFQKYRRSNELVVVIIQDAEPNKDNALKCSADGHLYYFGISPKEISDNDDFYNFGTRISKEVIFNKQKIIQNLK